MAKYFTQKFDKWNFWSADVILLPYLMGLATLLKKYFNDILRINQNNELVYIKAVELKNHLKQFHKRKNFLKTVGSNCGPWSSNQLFWFADLIGGGDRKRLLTQLIITPDFPLVLSYKTKNELPSQLTLAQQFTEKCVKISSKVHIESDLITQQCSIKL